MLKAIGFEAVLWYNWTVHKAKKRRPFTRAFTQSNLLIGLLTQAYHKGYSEASMQKTYRYRMYPTPTQEKALNTMMFHSKRLYNLARIDRMWRYSEGGETINWKTQKTYLITLGRKVDSGFGMLPYDTATYVLQRLDNAYQKFFVGLKTGRRAGFPKHMKYCSTLEYVYPKGIWFNPVKVSRKTKLIEGVDNSVSWSKLYLMNVGEVRVRFHRHLPSEGRISYASVTCDEQSRRWFANIVVDDLQEERENLSQYHPDMKAIGIDMGIAHAFTLSDGTMIDPEHHYQSKLRELRILQRKFQRQLMANNPECFDEKGSYVIGKRISNISNRMQDTRNQLKRLHFQVAEQRKDWLHNFTRHLVDNYDIIAIEDLSLGFMIKNKGLALKALDISFGAFKLQLEYKCKEAGKTLIKVNPAYTSQTCRNCGSVDRENRKSQSEFHCLSCGHKDNADINAAKNILSKALGSASARGLT
jgi:putative transposase